jgi:hypothetical protein
VHQYDVDDALAVAGNDTTPIKLPMVIMVLAKIFFI